MIKVEHLVKRYGNRNVVDDLTFTVEKGQIVGFLGPNGAGKSTTMNMITGYISATEGTIEIDGVDIFDEPEKAKKKIGYLPEMPPLYPDMLVREYLSFVCDIKKVKRDKKDAMISKVMRRAKITDVSERLIKTYPKVTNSVWELPARWLATRKSLFLMNRRLDLTQNRFWKSAI